MNPYSYQQQNNQQTQNNHPYLVQNTPTNPYAQNMYMANMGNMGNMGNTNQMPGNHYMPQYAYFQQPNQFQNQNPMVNPYLNQPQNNLMMNQMQQANLGD